MNPTARGNLRWAMTLLALLIAVLLIAAYFPRQRQAKIPGPEAEFCRTLGNWADNHHLNRASIMFNTLAERLEKKQWEAGVRLGQIALVTFHDKEGLGLNEFSKR